MYLKIHCNADTIKNSTITYCETEGKDGLVSIKKFIAMQLFYSYTDE